MVTKKSSQTSTSTKTTNISSPITPLTIDLEEEDKNLETMEGKNNQKINIIKIIFELF
jgi:ABC-type sugar transport system ATPase subunit